MLEQQSVLRGEKEVAGSVNTRKYFFFPSFTAGLLPWLQLMGLLLLLPQSSVLLCSAFKWCRFPHTVSGLCWLQEAFSCSCIRGFVLVPDSGVGVRSISSFTGTTELPPSACRRKRLTQPFPKSLWHVCPWFSIIFWQCSNIFLAKEKHFIFGFFPPVFTSCCF